MRHLRFFPAILFFVLSVECESQVLTPLVDSIPMRDGKKLAVDIYVPSGCNQCPVILIQTPYNRLWYRFSLPLGVKTNLNASNYAFAIADWRGFYGSAGSAYSGSPSRGEDGYDCVQWVATQSWCNGKVGTWGPSALGGVQFQTARENPPNLVCMVPQVNAPMTQSYLAYYPGGIYRTEYVEQLDGLGYGTSPIVLANPVKNLLWNIVEAGNQYADSILVPAFMQGGWYDHTIEPMLAWFNDIRAQSPANIKIEHRLLMGPWVHGGSGAAYVGSSVQGELSYPNAAGWPDSLALLFFDYHMRAMPNNWDNTPFVQYYQMGDDVWLNSATWPPSGVNNYKLYFHSDTSMDAFAPSSSGASYLNYAYDPTDPSPTIGGPTLRNDLDQGPYDQDSAVESRNDILKFTTATLTQDAVLKGAAKVYLTVSSDRTDTDFCIRLTDVYPDGRSMLVADGAFRMRFRNGFTAQDTSLMIPGQTYTCSIDLPSTCITFKAGHKIRVDVTSSNYPRFNRNANNGGVMYPGNNGDSLLNPVIANNRIYVDDLTNHSYLQLPLSSPPPLSAVDLPINESVVKIIPNPLTDKSLIDYRSLDFNVVSIRITDIRGRIVGTCNPDPNKKMISIKKNNLPDGVYLLKLLGHQRNSISKLVIR